MIIDMEVMKMWWRKNPNRRIDKLLEMLKEFDVKWQKFQAKVDILELKISNALVKKKLKEPLEEAVETEKSISPDGLDDLRKLA